MTALGPWIKRFDDVRARLHGMEWLPQLLMRVFLGYFFFQIPASMPPFAAPAYSSSGPSSSGAPSPPLPVSSPTSAG